MGIIRNTTILTILLSALPTSYAFRPCISHRYNIKSESRHVSKMFNADLQPDSTLLANLIPHTFAFNDASSIALSDESTNLSLYFTLFLYVLTLPGLFSLVTRSVKVKEVQKNYDIPGPSNPTAKPLKQTAAEIMAYFKALNYEVAVAEEVITFKGVMGRSTSQAYFLTFCTFMGLGSLGLVLSILLPDIGGKAYLLTLLSPYAGIFYWRNAQREDTVKVKMETSDNGQITTVTAQGGKDDLERFAKQLQLTERGKIYVQGIFEENPGFGGGSVEVPVRQRETNEEREREEEKEKANKSEEVVVIKEKIDEKSDV